jgi:hypothetical protein
MSLASSRQWKMDNDKDDVIIIIWISDKRLDAMWCDVIRCSVAKSQHDVIRILFFNHGD